MLGCSGSDLNFRPAYLQVEATSGNSALTSRRFSQKGQSHILGLMALEGGVFCENMGLTLRAQMNPTGSDLNFRRLHAQVEPTSGNSALTP